MIALWLGTGLWLDLVQIVFRVEKFYACLKRGYDFGSGICFLQLPVIHKSGGGGGLHPGQQSLRPYPTIHQANHNTLTFHYVSSLRKTTGYFLHIILMCGNCATATFHESQHSETFHVHAGGHFWGRHWWV